MQCAKNFDIHVHQQWYYSSNSVCFQGFPHHKLVLFLFTSHTFSLFLPFCSFHPSALLLVLLNEQPQGITLLYFFHSCCSSVEVLFCGQRLAYLSVVAAAAHYCKVSRTIKILVRQITSVCVWVLCLLPRVEQCTVVCNLLWLIKHGII